MARPSTISTAARVAPAARRNALPGRLSPGMACDTAFRIIARRHLAAILAQHDGTCRGDPDALHQIRIALTHLRTAIRFFSPMVDDALRPTIWAELKWLKVSSAWCGTSMWRSSGSSPRAAMSSP
jgi:inorganic triphosphatase YgiF